MAIDKKELWVEWTKSAMSRYVIPESIDDAKELVDDMIEVATDFADGMLDEYDERFGGGGGRRGGRTRKPEEAEE